MATPTTSPPTGGHATAFPSNPRAWLMTTARNRATDRIRRDRTLATKFGLLVTGNHAEVPMNTATFPDERLELIFTCCRATPRRLRGRRC
ncbi:hypothetical protein [Nonomuraea basaltis]|uniref:hypothetical protein n=1 Tax=Nonomuraea basaltis TaxID=2495887 RepID=UPI001485CDFA|nr:hypothetical protein [Nonomuraea basaltis]